MCTDTKSKYKYVNITKICKIVCLKILKKNSKKLIINYLFFTISFADRFCCFCQDGFFA